MVWYGIVWHFMVGVMIGWVLADRHVIAPCAAYSAPLIKVTQRALSSWLKAFLLLRKANFFVHAIKVCTKFEYCTQVYELFW